jgi:hypothetical protein
MYTKKRDLIILQHTAKQAAYELQKRAEQRQRGRQRRVSQDYALATNANYYHTVNRDMLVCKYSQAL